MRAALLLCAALRAEDDAYDYQAAGLRPPGDDSPLPKDFSFFTPKRRDDDAGAPARRWECAGSKREQASTHRSRPRRSCLLHRRSDHPC